MSQCHILSKHYVSTSSIMKFSITIHLIICSYEHKVWNHYRIKTQIAHREWVITFLTNKEKWNNIGIHIIWIKYNLLKHSSRHSTTYCVTSHLNIIHLTHYHIIHVLKNQNTISLNQSISTNTQALCNKYTKTQSYM